MSSTSNKNTNTTSKIDSAQSASSSNKQSIPQIQTHSQSTSNQQHHSQQHGHHLSHHSSQQHSQQQKPHGIPVSSSQSQKQHLVPPRYQPPPPVSGILKNISARSGIPTLNHQSHSAAETNTAHHLNLKFPQEVPKLTAVYIPDSVRTGNPSRIATRSLQHPRQSLNSVQQQQQSQQPSPQSQQVSTDDEQTTSRANAAHQSQQQQEMLKFVRKSDTDSVSAHSPNPSTSSSSNNFNRMTSGEQNRHFQSLITELRSLKEANQRLSDDNQELRDLCCFLDDDRQKGRKLAREWQRFGRYTASVMRQEVSAYQNKLRQLDDKQQELIRDNLELKELCLYLDEERANVTASIPPSCSSCGASIRLNASAGSSNTLRDDGDGSSSSTNDEPMPTVRQFDRANPELNLRSALNDQTLQYVRSLERRILEHELANPNTTNNIDNNLAAPSLIKNSTNISKSSENTNTTAQPNELLSNRPEAVVRAMQILEVREQLERDRAGNPLNPSISPEHMDDGEKALLREMCNVVWRKLEENPTFQFRPSSAPKNIAQDSQNNVHESKNIGQATNWPDQI